MQEPKAILWCQRLGYAWQSTAKAKCKIQRFVFSWSPKRRGLVQARPHLTKCCLTLHSSGPPTALRTSHQAQGLRPIVRLLSGAQRRRGPLNSNVRRHRPSAGGAYALVRPRVPETTLKRCASYLHPRNNPRSPRSSARDSAIPRLQGTQKWTPFSELLCQLLESSQLLLCQ
jgi:hypothetical protein